MAPPRKGKLAAERNEYQAQISLLQESNARLREFIRLNNICSHGCEFCKRMNIPPSRGRADD